MSPAPDGTVTWRELLGETVGGRIGLTVRGDRRVSASTVVEVVTTGVLVQRLQRDPELPGVVFVQIDGLSEAVLRRALRSAGPTLPGRPTPQ